MSVALACAVAYFVERFGLIDLPGEKGDYGVAGTLLLATYAIIRKIEAKHA
jgi:hypothetical protein